MKPKPRHSPGPVLDLLNIGSGPLLAAGGCQQRSHNHGFRSLNKAVVSVRRAHMVLPLLNCNPRIWADKRPSEWRHADGGAWTCTLCHPPPGTVEIAQRVHAAGR